MKGRRCGGRTNWFPQLLLHPLPHLLGRILGISDGKDLIGPGVAFADQMGDTPGEDGGLACARAGNDQHRSVDVFDGFALALIGLERSRT